MDLKLLFIHFQSVLFLGILIFYRKYKLLVLTFQTYDEV